MIDPLGQQPLPITGTAGPDLSDPTLVERVNALKQRFAGIWISYEPQEAIMAKVRQYMAETRGVRGVPIGGRRLSQETQAGKSALAWRLKADLAKEREAAGLPPNLHQVVIVTIEKFQTLKAFYLQILAQLGDDFLDLRRREGVRPGQKAADPSKLTLPVLEQRIKEWCARLEVELLVVDEVQRLDRASDENDAVTVRLQTFLDRGIVPLLLIGNGKSPAFFRKNQDFAARLGNPLVLPRLVCAKKGDADTEMFKKFSGDFAEALVVSGAVHVRAGLTSLEMIDALHQVSQGHVGRVARLLEQAFEFTAERGALTIEPYDLSKVTRGYAIDAGWVDSDPFSKP